MKGTTNVPSCNGPLIHDPSPKGKVFCVVCKRSREQHFAGVKRMDDRVGARVDAITKATQDTTLTGTALQKHVTAASEQALVDSFQDALGGRAPADFALMACGSMARREMVAYSDIDAVLVLSNDEPSTLEYFQGVVNTVHTRLLMSGGVTTQFMFCPGGLSPREFTGVIGTLIEQATDSRDGDHVRGALFTRRVMGNEQWGKAYVAACEKALKEGGRGRAAALANIRQHLTRRATEWAELKKGDLKIDVKQQLYRPIHMIMTDLALYYGVPGLETRGQVLGLVEKKKMSLEVANVVMQMLEDYARVATALQLAAGTEIHWVVLRAPRPTDGDDGAYITQKKLPVADAGRQRAVREMARRVATFWNLSEAWYREKGRKYALSRGNPFRSKHPFRDYGPPDNAF